MDGSGGAPTDMTVLVFSLDETLPLFGPLCQRLSAQPGELEQRRFPDGETYLKVNSSVENRACIILVDLVNPDATFLPLAFLASTLRELGAESVGLVAPYLSYMRQDTRFQPGEAVTSRIFAQLVCSQVDWLVTVDPHLHRYQYLSEIYSIPATAVAGAPALSDWFGLQQEPLLLVGPDIESEQWVSAIAKQTGQPFVVGRKVRRGDREVVVTLPDVSQYRDHTAVIVDDVISSGYTVLETLKALKTEGFKTVDCVTVHGIFADAVDVLLREQGLRRLISSNSTAHASNAVDLSPLLHEPIEQMIARFR